MSKSLPTTSSRSLTHLVLFLAGLFILSPGRAKAAGLLIADGGNGGVLEIKEQNVVVTINNGVAVTEVTQIFQNTENRQVEALYTFPVPEGASVASFSMWINGKEMVGEVLEKKRAREIYNSYKQIRRDPGLLEQTDYRTFDMRIFPIPPKAEQRVQISYYQELDFDHDWASYVYPLATSSRQGITQKTAGKLSFTLNVRSEVPIALMESPSHPKSFAIAKHTDSYYEASLETQNADLGRDIVLAYQVARPRSGVDVITSRQKGEDGYFMMTITAGEDAAAQDKGMDYVFVQDISGSMNDDGKLDLSRRCVGAFINSLGAKDRFEVATFNVQAQMLFKQLQTADEKSKPEAIDFLARQNAAGGTVLQPAINGALKYADPTRTLNVVIFSDGLTEPGDREKLLQLIKARPANTRVFCIGVGNDVNRPLLEQLAQESGGLAAFLSSDENFERQAQAFRNKLMRPVISDMKIDFAGLDAYDIQPAKIPNLYYGAPVRVYGRYKQSGDMKVTLAGQMDRSALTKTATISFPAEDGANPQIERMWAFHKIQYLLNEAAATGSQTGALDEVIRLGEGYSIATEYTSFLVLENDAEFARWNITQRNALRLERDRSSLAQVQSQLESIRNKAAADLGPEPPTAPPAPSAPAVIPPSAAPQSAVPNVQINAPANQPARGFDVPTGGFGGGGAIDPASAAMILILAVIAAWAAFRRVTRVGK